MRNKLGFVVFGIVFGFTLSRVGASDYDIIVGMFTGQNLKIAAVIGLAIIVGFIGMKILHIRGQTRDGQAIIVSHKTLGKWSLLGGGLLGIGWGISGACPGTVLAQLGEGKVYGFFTFAGMILGTYIYALLKERMPDL